MAAPSANFVPYDDRDGWIWLDGKMVPWRDAKIHVLTHSLHYGSCVFEGERAYEGKVFRRTDHSKRLHKSAELVGYKCPLPVAELDADQARGDGTRTASRTAISGRSPGAARR